MRIDQGWTLLEAIDGTQVNLPGVGLTPFQGVPYSQFDFTSGYLTAFGRSLSGRTSTSRTDSIAKRLLPAETDTPGATVTIPIELIGLQLRSASTVGGPFQHQHVYVTLQSARGGPQTLGVMSIRFDDDHGGVCATTFEIYFDLRVGALDAAPMPQPAKAFVGRETPWRRTPPAGAWLIPGVNSELAESFHPSDVVVEATNADTYRARLAG